MKIGILTHYYNSTNYGGSLQAYALCKVLNQMGHDAQQICIDYSANCYNIWGASALSPVKRRITKPVKKLIASTKRLLHPSSRKVYQQKLQQRTRLLAAFQSFNQGRTPHSDMVYTGRTLSKAVDCYDAFITGSDQVWNPIWYFPPFFLNFVPDNKIKLAYAASIGQKSLPDNLQEVFRRHLTRFTGISVREQDAEALLAPLTNTEVTCVLDPTLLLTKEDWEQVCAPRQVAPPYALCYFLDNEPSIRNTAAQYAKQHGLTLVNIADAAGEIHINDRGFGDIVVKDPSVEVFLSLIRHAKYVFTDSFHASVFSLLFQRQFVAFPRGAHKAMSSRLTNLTGLFNIPQRFCCCEENAQLAYINILSDIDYSEIPADFVAKKQHSLAFLKRHLSGSQDDSL